MEWRSSLFPCAFLSRLDEFLEWMCSSGRIQWEIWNAVAFVIEEVTADDLMVPPGLKPNDSLLVLPC